MSLATAAATTINITLAVLLMLTAIIITISGNVPNIFVSIGITATSVNSTGVTTPSMSTARAVIRPCVFR